jgi:hypothetical protein
MNLGFLDKALDGLEGKDLGALVDTLQQAAARTLEFDGEYPAQQACRLLSCPVLRLRNTVFDNALARQAGGSASLKA